MLDRATIEQYVERLVGRFQPQSVHLFGSQAAGTAHVPSAQARWGKLTKNG